MRTNSPPMSLRGRLRPWQSREELPSAYKSICPYRLPLRGRHAEVVVPYDRRTHRTVGRDHWARRCRNYEMRTNSPPMSLRGRLRPWQSRAGTTVCVQTCLPLPSAAALTARRGRRALRPWNAPHRRARPLGAPVQELPNVYKLVRLYCLPFTRTAG